MRPRPIPSRALPCRLAPGRAGGRALWPGWLALATLMAMPMAIALLPGEARASETTTAIRSADQHTAALHALERSLNQAPRLPDLTGTGGEGPGAPGAVPPASGQTFEPGRGAGRAALSPAARCPRPLDPGRGPRQRR